MRNRTVLSVALGAVGCILIGEPADAQQLGADRQRAIEIDGSLGFSNRYIFRGYEQDGSGEILQPEIAAGYTVLTATGGAVRTIALAVSAWSSIHAGTPGHPGAVGWYEADLVAALAAGFANGWTAEIGYTAYLSPTNAFAEVHEIAVTLGLGTIGKEETIAFSPGFLLAREIVHRGDDEATYLELQGEFTWPSTGVIRWTSPLTVGMSPDGYYQDASNANQLLGFANGGLEANTDLPTLGFRSLPITVTAAMDLTFVNRPAALTISPLERRLWNGRVAFAFSL